MQNIVFFCYVVINCFPHCQELGFGKLLRTSLTPADVVTVITATTTTTTTTSTTITSSIATTSTTSGTTTTSITAATNVNLSSFVAAVSTSTTVTSTSTVATISTTTLSNSSDCFEVAAVKAVRTLPRKFPPPVLQALVVWRHWWLPCYWEWVDTREMDSDSLRLVLKHLQQTGVPTGGGQFSLDVPNSYPQQLPMGCIFSSTQAILGGNFLDLQHLRYLAEEKHHIDFSMGTMHDAHHYQPYQTVDTKTGAISLSLVQGFLKKCTNLNLFKMKTKQLMFPMCGRFLVCGLPKKASEMEKSVGKSARKKRKKSAN